MPRTRIIPNTIAKLDHINGDAIDLEDCREVYGDDELACMEDNMPIRLSPTNTESH